MATNGGYRQPANPAPVSGPGAMSQRTDGGPSQPRMQLPNAGYGEQAQFQQDQSGAPMAMDQGPPPALPPGLFDPTQRPNDPVTSGAALGPGAGPEALGTSSTESRKEIDQISKYLPMMERMAGQMDAPRSFRSLVQFLKAYQ